MSPEKTYITDGWVFDRVPDAIPKIPLDDSYKDLDIKSVHDQNQRLELLKDYNLARYLDPNNFIMLSSAKTYKDVLETNFSFTSNADKQLLKSFRAEGWTGKHISSGINKNDIEAYKTYAMDTSLGGNEVINSRWGFGRDDDIIQPINALRGDPEKGGLGRVYFENYQAHQHILYLTVGVPEFMEMWKFYNTCMDGNLANTVNSGEGSLAMNLGETIGTMVKWTTKLALFPVLAPVAALNGLEKLVNWAQDGPQVSRYYEVKPAMRLYFKYVNTIFARLAVMMGLAGGLAGNTATNQGTISLTELYESSGSIPQFLQNGGLMMERILTKREWKYYGVDPIAPLESKIHEKQDIATSSRRGESGDSFLENVMKRAAGEDKYLGFRINKNTDASESLSNSSGQSSIASALNSAASTAKDARFSMSGGWDNVFKVTGIGDALGGARDLLTGAINSIGLGSLATTVMTGSGFIDIPDVWTSSTFTKNHSFNMTFRAPSGNNATILQDCYVPLAILLPLALPRTVGQNSYSSPFIIRAYCRGMFAVPIGLVESMSITRGASEFGWNLSKLPTVINVSLSIKDLTPIMHLALSHKPLIGLKLDEVNTTSLSYFQALSAMGPKEMLFGYNRVMTTLGIKKYVGKQIFSVENIESLVGSTAIARFASLFYGRPQHGS